jgi:hypothetical protein
LCSWMDVSCSEYTHIQLPQELAQGGSSWGIISIDFRSVVAVGTPKKATQTTYYASKLGVLFGWELGHPCMPLPKPLPSRGWHVPPCWTTPNTMVAAASECSVYVICSKGFPCFLVIICFLGAWLREHGRSGRLAKDMIPERDIL